MDTFVSSPCKDPHKLQAVRDMLLSLRSLQALVEVPENQYRYGLYSIYFVVLLDLKHVNHSPECHGFAWRHSVLSLL